MSIKKLGVAFALAAAVTGLAACGQSSALPEGPAVNAKIASEYQIPDFTVSEFRAASGDGTVCVAVDGYQASGISCWRAQGSEQGTPQILATYNTREGSVTEFKPGIDSSRTCFAIDSYKSGGLSCVPAQP